MIKRNLELVLDIYAREYPIVAVVGPRQSGKRVIPDEIQSVPALFSYLQEYVDYDPEPAQYILTGSHQFLLMENIAQSLAGRIITFRLFPFTANEIYYQREEKA